MRALLAALALNCSTHATTATGTTEAELPEVWKRFISSTTFSSKVTVSLDGDYVVIDSNAIPNHKSPYFSGSDSRYEADSSAGFRINPSHIASQTLTFRIPLQPAPAATKKATPMGPIGVALNGVPLFNQYAGGGAALGMEIVSFDQYGGHPQQQNQYHYHVEPKGLSGAPTMLGSAALLGFLLDGYPVYGPSEDGHTITSADLDVYHGHSKATADYPEGVYHYHFTADAPYLNGDGFYGVAGTVSQ